MSKNVRKKFHAVSPVLLGLFTRLAVISLLTIMCVAIDSTKIPILIKSGFWKMAHDSRSDSSMVMGSLFLLIVGAGLISLDARFSRFRKAPPHDSIRG